MMPTGSRSGGDEPGDLEQTGGRHREGPSGLVESSSGGGWSLLPGIGNVPMIREPLGPGVSCHPTWPWKSAPRG